MQPPVDVQRTEPRGRGIRWRHCRHCAAAPQCFAHSAWSVLWLGIDVLTPSERVCHFGGDRRPPLTRVAAGGASGRTALRGGTRRCEGHRARLSVAMRWLAGGKYPSATAQRRSLPRGCRSVPSKSAASSACVRAWPRRRTRGSRRICARRTPRPKRTARRSSTSRCGAHAECGTGPQGCARGTGLCDVGSILVGIPSRHCALHVCRTCRVVPCRAGYR
jgi:hypothetical protein